MINRLIGRGQRPKIFISYRRDDAKKKADQLHENLERHFGDNSTFMDIEAIEGGHHYRRVIQSALDSCEVFLAVIGPNWLAISDENNVRRLDKKDDWVRFEIEAALKRKDILVVPVLVENATLPQPDELPETLQSLTNEIQAHKVEDNNWDSDVTKLIQIIEGNIGRRDSPWLRLKWLIPASLVVALGLGGLILWNLVPDRPATGIVNNNGIAAVTSPTATSSASPITIPEDQSKKNQDSTNSANNNQLDTATTSTPTPTATPDLLNTVWNYSFDGVLQYVIQLRGNNEFYYWRTRNDFIDRSIRFEGTWKLIGTDEIELTFTPTDPRGKEVHTGKIKGKEIRNGEVRDANGKLLTNSWSAKQI